MDIKNVKPGMRVRISRGPCDATRTTCTMTRAMKGLRGTISEVREIYSNGMITLDNGWVWNPKDLLPAYESKETTKIKPPKIQVFDEQELWV